MENKQPEESTSTKSSFVLSECLSVEAIERLYHEKVLKHDFYGDSYGAEWNVEPYQDMAVLLTEILRPGRHVDVGCGKGFLVLAMRELGVESFGLDFSPALVKQAPKEIQKYLTVATAENWIDRGALGEADLITYMEVLEHLPLGVCASILQTLRDNFVGRLFITTPSYGIDARWKLGLLTNNGNPTWQEDMAANIPFRQIVLQDGLPHHGHISLCSYRWWTEFFLLNGWIRSLDLERKAAKRFDATLKKYRWNPYILEHLALDSFVVAPATSNQLGNGWHEGENLGTEEGGRWTNGRGEVYVATTKPWKAIDLVLSAPSINVIQEYNLTVVIERQVVTPDCKLGWEPVHCSAPVGIELREKKLSVRLPVAWAPGSGSAARNVYRVLLLSCNFSPRDLGLSTDDRFLGLFIHQIAIEIQ
jgi:SAM-dependent methyltransferase